MLHSLICFCVLICSTPSRTVVVMVLSTVVQSGHLDGGQEASADEEDEGGASAPTGSTSGQEMDECRFPQ